MGTDINPLFIEHCLLQKAKYSIENANVQFSEHDFLKEPLKPSGDMWGDKFDICTFGFEVSLDLLRDKQSSFNRDAHLIVPLSHMEFDREQDFKVLQYKGSDQFDVIEDIMRTSFARRIDESKLTEASLDVDYFNNMQRQSKL